MTASAVLVGRSGQLYYPVATSGWQRRGAGGVTVDLSAAVRSRGGSASGDDVLAVGLATPPFRFQNGAWRAEPLPARGPAALTATGAMPVLAVGRHIHILDAGEWVRRVSAPRQVTAAWAAGPRALVVATSDGALARWDGRRLTSLRTPLPAGDPIVHLVGASPAALFGRGRSGSWIRIDRASCALLSRAPELPDFEEQAAGLGPDGALWLGGTVTGSGGARRAVLSRSERNRLVLAAELPALAPGDRVAVILGHAPTGELLVATRGGAVRVRNKQGTWAESAASGALPTLTSRGGPASGGPARTR